jgi:transposase
MKEKDTASPKLYIGLDVHKQSWRVQLSTDLFQGKGFTMRSSAEELKHYVDTHWPDHKVYCAFEAGCCGYGAHRAFIEFGWDSLVFNPTDLHRTGTHTHQKTDSIDARIICRELKDGRLRGITVPSKEREELRGLFRYRNELVKDFRQIKNRIKSQLLFMGKQVPIEYDNPNWSHGFRDWIRGLDFNYETGSQTMAMRMEQFDRTDKMIREVSTQLRAYCRKHYKQDYYLLRSVPGIGGLVACGLLSEVGDLRQFKNFKQFASIMGLIPRMSQSGEGGVKSRGITPRGKQLIRSYIIEAAWQAVRVDPALQEYYRGHLAKGLKSQQVIVKVARKLLSRIHAVIRTETPYEIGIIQ